MVFSPAVIELLGYYVYCLEDPRSGEVFYVGKGTGNRIFDHLSCAVKARDRNEKLDQIRQIVRSGREVRHHIIRHGLTESTAFEVEAALIDFIGIDAISNIQGGHLSREYGMCTAEEINAMYDPEDLETEEAVLLVNLGKKYHADLSAKELYDVSRKSWSVAVRRENVKYVVAVYGGLTREVYQVRKWVPVWGSRKTRWSFRGKIAKRKVREALRHKSVSMYFGPGVANPVKYLNC